jgi:putative transposase
MPHPELVILRGDLKAGIMTETKEPVELDEDEKQVLAQRLVDQVRTKAVDLVGSGGPLTGLTKQALETALEEELAEHLGYDKYDPAGRNSGNSRNGTRAKMVLTDVGPVELDVLRDPRG